MISEDERRRRENAVKQALASIGLEGLAVPHHELEHARRFIDGEISLDEFVQAARPTLPGGSSSARQDSL
jgi:hypothetical protein